MQALERAMGIEPTALAWEARVLPLYDARILQTGIVTAVAKVTTRFCAAIVINPASNNHLPIARDARRYFPAREFPVLAAPTRRDHALLGEWQSGRADGHH